MTKFDPRNRPQAGPLESRDARGELVNAAHIVFDRIWVKDAQQAKARKCAYIWLAYQLGTTEEECHFSRMGIEHLERAIKLCRKTDARGVKLWVRRRQNGEKVTN